MTLDQLSELAPRPEAKPLSPLGRVGQWLVSFLFFTLIAFLSTTVLALKWTAVFAGKLLNFLRKGDSN